MQKLLNTRGQIFNMQMENRFIQIPDVLAVLAHDGDYNYIDRVANSQSKSLVLHYLREALRDFNALKRNPPEDMDEEAKELLYRINPDYLEHELDRIRTSDDAKRLREVVSYICAKALARASKFVKVVEEEKAPSSQKEGEG